MIISGSSALVRSVAHRSLARQSCHQWSRALFHGTSSRSAAEHTDVEASAPRGGFVGHRLHRHDFAAPMKSVGGEQYFRLRIGQARRDGRRAEPGEERKKMPPTLMMASIATTISGVIGMNTPMASPLPRPSERSALRPGSPPGAVPRRRERPSPSSPSQTTATFWSTARAGVFVEAIVNDVHPAADAPVRPGGLPATGPRPASRARRTGCRDPLRTASQNHAMSVVERRCSSVRASRCGAAP